jgi:hypothetical protein
MSVVIFCFILTQSLFKIFKIFLVLRYEKFMDQANHKWEIGFPLILVYLMYFIIKNSTERRKTVLANLPYHP